MNQYAQEFFELSAELLCVLSPEGTFVQLNPVWEEVLGFTVAEMTNRSFLDFIHPTDRAVSLAAASKLRQGQKLIKFQNRCISKDGSYKWFMWNVSHSREKNVILAVVHDLTNEVLREKKSHETNQELQLAQQESEFYKLALDSADTVAFTDAKGTITYVNDLLCKLSGYSRDELVGSNHRIFKSGLMAAGFFKQMWLDISEGKTWRGEICNRKKDGTLFWVDTVIVPCIGPQGKPIQYIAIRRDITSRKAQEIELHREKRRAEQATAAKSTFLANMSHEIRTPLNGIVGLANLLAVTPLSAEQVQYVEGLKKSGDQLLLLINDILDLSKIEAGKLALETVRFNIAETIDDVIKVLGPNAREKHLTISYSEVSLPKSDYLGDPGRFRQILFNLVGNAIKFTQTGGISITVRGEEIDSGRSLLKIQITDTGIGLELDATKRLFEPFSQGDLSTTRRFGGTGLGLSICRRIIELMGGRIGVESTKGIGSTFWFEVPLKHAERNQSPSERTMVPTTSSNSLHILVVEDNQLNQLVAVRTLEKMGHRAAIAGNGKEALAILKDIPFDLVFMDCQMPEMDGYETTAYIRTHDEVGGKALPIVAMTASAIVGEEERCLKAGMNAFITKPVRIEQIQNALNKFCPKVSEVQKQAA